MRKDSCTTRLTALLIAGGIASSVASLMGCSDDAARLQTQGANTPIAEIQGTGDVSPFAGAEVSIQGVVSGDFQDDDADSQSDLGGFFVLSDQPDSDPRTSEGLFVFDDPMTLDVNVGDRVQVSGTVVEAEGETQLVADSVRVLGAGTAQPTALTLPAERSVRNEDGVLVADLERFEGMLVTLADDPRVVDHFNLERYGAIAIAPGPDRPEQLTNRASPDRRHYRDHRRRTAATTLVLDDGHDAQNRHPVRYLDTDVPSPALGDIVKSATGVVSFRRGGGSDGMLTYRLMPTAEPVFESSARSLTVPQVGGDVRIMSLNALNFFATLDRGNQRCGPARDAGCRGADSDVEFRRQRDKLVTTIEMADVHLVALMEVENGTDAPLESLIRALNHQTDAWRFVRSGNMGDDVIRVALLYDSRHISPAGDAVVLDASVDARFDDRLNRPALAQAFVAAAGGNPFTVAVNHLKSKGSPCDDFNDPNRGDGQGNCNQTRRRAAAVLADWLNADPADSGSADAVILGDLNAYLEEDPLKELEAAGFTNLLTDRTGAPRYTFAFRGEVGALDHALATPSFARRVSGVAVWHINADYPALLDYNTDRDRGTGYFDADSPLRASDHDPVLLGVDAGP